MRQLIAALAVLVMMSATAWAEDTPVGDAARGAKIARNCMVCHSITDRSNKVGPSLVGVFGSKVATAEGYTYSDAMRSFAHDNPVWGEAALDAFLTDPRGTVAGTKMGFLGIAGPQDRADVIAYLKTLTAATPAPAPPPATAQPDASRGAQLADSLHCTACHAFADDASRVGPSLHRIYGGPVANVTGFPYSDAIRQFAVDEPVWGAIVLDRFIAAPKALIPGTKMSYAGVASAQDRADLIAYLRAIKMKIVLPQ